MPAEPIERKTCPSCGREMAWSIQAKAWYRERNKPVPDGCPNGCVSTFSPVNTKAEADRRVARR